MGKSKSAITAETFINAVNESGWEVERAYNGLVTITKRIEPGSKESFARADSEYYSLLGIIPTTSSGSIWGTDGGGVGALSAIDSGEFRINKSGCSKNVIKAIEKNLKEVT